MPNLNITKPELIWPGKYDENGNRVVNRGMALPFQVVETIREGHATREPGRTLELFNFSKPQEQSEWRNKLIWGDNLLVMASLLEEFAGKVDLIYIDPPFATGADFSFITQVGDDIDLELTKDHSIIEEKAYRDTWGKGLESYFSMIFPRLRLIYDLLSEQGSLFLHVDETVGYHLKLILDEIFGTTSYINGITWKRSDAHSDIGQGAKHLGKVCDIIFYYSKKPGQQKHNIEFTPLPQSTADKWYRHIEEKTGRRYNKADITGPGGARKGNPVYEWKGIKRAWRSSKERMQELENEGRKKMSETTVMIEAFVIFSSYTKRSLINGGSTTIPIPKVLYE